MKKLMMLALVLVSCSAFAAGEDLENCRWADGRAMNDARLCDAFRQDKAKEDEVQKQQAEELEQSRHRQAERAAEKARQRALVEAENQQRVAALAREEQVNRRNREQMERDEAKEDGAKKRACGKDFMALRVGMKLERFEECHEALSYVTETVGKAGTVETYRATFYMIDAKDGRIVSYTKRRF